MSQSSFIVAMLLGGFVLFLAAEQRLGMYVGFLIGRGGAGNAAGAPAAPSGAAGASPFSGAGTSPAVIPGLPPLPSIGGMPGAGF